MDIQLLESGLVVHVIAFLIAESPEITGERIEMEIIVDAAVIVAEDMVATDTDQVVVATSP